jgi:hypothetical protein
MTRRIFLFKQPFTSYDKTNNIINGPSLPPTTSSIYAMHSTAAPFSPMPSSLLFNTAVTDTPDTASASATESSIDHIVVRVNFFSMLFGILGNFVCICVLCSSILLKRKFNWYLLLLATADFLFCFIAFVNYYVMMDGSGRAIFDLSRVTCYLTDYIVCAVDTFCVFLTLVLSLDRLYAIVRPIKVRQFFTNLYPRQISAVCLAVLLVIYSPEIFLSQRRYSFNEDQQLTTTTAPVTTTRSSSTLFPFAITSPDSFLIVKTPSKNTSLIRPRPFNYSSYLTNRSNTINFIKNRLGNHTSLGESSHKSTLLDTSSPSTLPVIEQPRCIYLTSYDSTSKMIMNKSDETRVAYIIYCKIILPVLLNALPALIILVLNSVLLFFIRAYYTNRPSPFFDRFLRFRPTTKLGVDHNSPEIKLNQNQKSYFLTIM